MPTATILSNDTITEMAVKAKENLRDDVESDGHFYLYRISYAWYAMIGFSLTMIIGTLSSWFFHKFYYSNILMENESESKIDANLFITPIRQTLLKTQGKPEKSNALAMSNSNGRISNGITFSELKTQDVDEEIPEPQKQIFQKN